MNELQRPQVSWLAMPDSEERQLKSLELLQGIISRLSTHSFVLKGWAVTLSIGLLTFNDSKSLARLAALAGVPILMFWILDAYLLTRERQYRACFERLRNGQAQAFDYQLGPIGVRDWSVTAFSKTLATFYLTLLIISSVLALDLL